MFVGESLPYDIKCNFPEILHGNLIEKNKGYRVFIHNTKSIDAQQQQKTLKQKTKKTKKRSKGTALLLSF